MNKRKTLSVLAFSLVAVLLAAGGIWRSASAGTAGVHPLVAGGTIELGKQGLYAGNIPQSVSYVYMDVIAEPLPPRFGHDKLIEYRPPALEVRFLNRNGGAVEDINALVYIFFNIGKAEAQAWRSGGDSSIAIWYANESTGRWEKCPTWFVHESKDSGMFDRLTCLAPGSGFYVLGHVGFDPLLFNPYNASNIRVVDFVRKYVPW